MTARPAGHKLPRKLMKDCDSDNLVCSHPLSGVRTTVAPIPASTQANPVCPQHQPHPRARHAHPQPIRMFFVRALMPASKIYGLWRPQVCRSCGAPPANSGCSPTYRPRLPDRGLPEQPRALFWRRLRGIDQGWRVSKCLLISDVIWCSILKITVAVFVVRVEYTAGANLAVGKIPWMP